MYIIYIHLSIYIYIFDRVTFNITYYPVFKNIGIVLEELHILLAPDEQHRNVFTDIPRICFKNGKSLKGSSGKVSFT